MPLLPRRPRALLLLPRALCRARSSVSGRVVGGTEATAFEIAPSTVPSLFASWWSQHGGPGLPQPAITSMRALFSPFWVFHASRVDAPSARLHVARVEAMSVAAGSTVPRAFAEHLGADAVHSRPFRADMLHLRDGVEADVEAFELREATAWQLCRGAWLAARRSGASGGGEYADAHFSGVTSERILTPVYIVEYRYLFRVFQCYLSGLSGAGGGVQQLAPWGGLSAAQLLQRAAAARPALAWLERHLPPKVLLGLANGALLLLRPLGKLLLWPPLLLGSLFAGSLWAGVRVTSGHRAHAAAHAAWAHTRRREAQAQAGMADEWLLRRPADQAASGASAGGGREARQTGTRTPPPPRRPPPVDAADPYAVLGLKASATEAEVKAAFRRELHRWHPDHAVESGFDAAACSERTQVIIAAYAVLRSPERRRAHDAGRRR